MLNKLRGQTRAPMKPEGTANAEGRFKAWAERRRDDAQGGLQLRRHVGDVGFVEG